mgnify:CR=1 FL=1
MQDNIGIITYPFTSGLYYLALSFQEHLKALGFNSILIPKKSFINKDGKWMGVFKYEVDQFEKIESSESYSLKILEICKRNNIKRIVSFETFMRDSSWVNFIIGQGIEVVDVPMPEWSIKEDLLSGRYRAFSKVFCLTRQSFNLFKDYSKAESISWDFSPDISTENKIKNDILTIYHPGSSAGLNQKNTKLVIEAFKSITYKDINLLISGNLEGYCISDSRIKYLGRNIPRQDVISAYKKSDCILSPSSREGLGLSFFEAKKAKCDIITTDAEPMKEHSKYLCRVFRYNKSESLVPFAITDVNEIAKQINRYYEDFHGK